MKKENAKDVIYEVHKKVCRKTGKVLEYSIKETDIDPEEYMKPLIEYVYSITKDNMEEK